MTLAYHPALTSPIQMLDVPVEQPAPRRYLATAVQREVCDWYGIARPALVGTQRGDYFIARARQLAMYIVRNTTSLSLGQIGIAFGGRDHSTVLHAVRAVADRLVADADLRADHDAIVEALGE
jgi:chromosomal replication initiator protein